MGSLWSFVQTKEQKTKTVANFVVSGAASCIAANAFDRSKDFGFPCVKDGWAALKPSCAFAWRLIGCHDTPFFYVPTGLVIITSKAMEGAKDSKWIFAGPKPKPKRGVKRNRDQVDAAEAAEGEDVKRPRDQADAAEAAEAEDVE
eukprot:s294_g6.t1